VQPSCDLPPLLKRKLVDGALDLIDPHSIWIVAQSPHQFRACGFSSPLIYRGPAPKALGDFSYAVDDSPQAKAKAKPRGLTPRPFSRSHARRPESRAALTGTFNR
jgi:hypothetical protein